MLNHYSFKWILQRVTAFFLIPLSFWFIYQCISFQNLDYEEIIFFFESYFNSILFLCMMIAMLIHGKLGCDTIIKDYIKKPYLQETFKVIINLITFISMFIVVLAIIKLSIL